jgi:hypothetical protein
MTKGNSTVSAEDTATPHEVSGERARGETTAAPPPSHLIPLPGGEWSLWRQMGLRGTGFPAERVLKLAAPECAAVADRLVACEVETEQALQGIVETLVRNSDGSNLNRHDPLVKAIRQVKKGKAQAALEGAWNAEDEVAAYTEAHERAEASRREFREAYAQGVAKISDVIREIVNEDRFSEAIIWQNHRAYLNGVAVFRRLLKEGGIRGARQRDYEHLIASYVQRYSLKNDTIGFFGPVGWLKWNSGKQPIKVRHGSQLLAERNVYFEHWCINALAARLSAEAGMRPWLAPRLVPHFRLAGRMLHRPMARPLELSAKQATVLRACDGEHTAQQIALELLRHPAHELTSPDEVFAQLEDLLKKGFISWELEVPVYIHPERQLKKLLVGIGDEALRERALGALGELEEARREVARAAGNAERLDVAQSNLEETFTRLTGVASTRAAGQTYGGRTLIYEDCRRNIEVELGEPLLRELGPPMTLLLLSARWFTYQVATAFRTILKRIYDELVSKTGSRQVDMISVWLKVNAVLNDESPTFIERLVPEFQERWARVLALPEGEWRVERSSAELQTRMLTEFAAAHAGWDFSRYHSPDVMIAARSAADIARGDYRFVMGELHMAGNTLGPWLFLAQHPTPEELLRAMQYDLPKARLIPLSPKNWPNVSARTSHWIVKPKDFCLTATFDSVKLPGVGHLPIGELLLEESADGLIVRTHDHRHRFEVIDAFGEILTGKTVNSFKLAAPKPHTPRVTIDRLVIMREAWRFAPAELNFAFVKDETERFLAARRWMLKHNLPHFVFAKVSIEMKPFFVDFDSPVYVDILAKIVRRAAETGGQNASIALTEMLPYINQTWLEDAEGNHYASELRIVAVDPKT